jgi:hypothetical protein
MSAIYENSKVIAQKLAITPNLVTLVEIYKDLATGSYF